MMDRDAKSTSVRRMMLTLAYALVVGAILWKASAGTLPGWVTRLYGFPGGDKIGHLLLIGGLALLLNLSLGIRQVRLGAGSVLLGSVVVGVLVVLEELSQLAIAQRTFSLADLLFSLAGIWLAGRMALALEPGDGDGERGGVDTLGRA